MSDPKDHIEQFFAYAHLPEKLQVVSKPFGDLAQRMIETLPRNPERTVMLRKLLEAKDAAVRALVAVVLLITCSAAFAQPPADAPLKVNPFPPGQSAHLNAGEVAPFTGQLIEDKEHARREFNNEQTAGELSSLKEEKGKKFISVPVFIAVIAGAAALGAALTVTGYELAKAKPAR